MKVLKLITTLLFICIFSEAKTQVYEQSFFLKMMPQTPQTVIGVTDKEKEAFRNQIKVVENYLDSLAQNYKHPMCSLEKSSQQEMFEFNRIWEELYQFHDAFFNEIQSKTIEQMSVLSQDEFTKQTELSEKLRKARNAAAKTMKDISGEENQIDKEMYDNHARYSQMRADLLTKSINSYKSYIENVAPKVKRADTILLAEITPNSKYPCAAIFNAQQLLATYKGYIELFVPPHTPKFE